MTSMVPKVVGKKGLGGTLQTKPGTEDPYLEQVFATRLNGKPSATKFKKVKRALPLGLSEHDGSVLAKVKRRAYRLDCALFTFLGIKFGWGSAIGLVPCAGDLVDCLLALMVMRTADQIEGGLPFFIKFHMLLNIAFDFAIGLAPFVGDMIDAMFKANTRNAVLLETYLRDQAQTTLKRGNLPIANSEPSDPKAFGHSHGKDRQGQHDGGDHPGRPPAYHAQGVTSSQKAGVTSISRSDTVSVTTPEEATVHESRGWLGRSKKRQDDLEAGHVKSSKPKRR
ncbi:hypothetical protein LEL_10587 [Akanthomyces lecanii RCEF 1005]|uniref:PH domain protein n=1 Tax=Akanthomyces lecanii RCEF 1005 TaxID=1081108 RepID=A0A162MQ71_CORDF|nr:hypothetical protein LEL_10587 [Akanthomyces lecanii RCEF 1005]